MTRQFLLSRQKVPKRKLPLVGRSPSSTSWSKTGSSFKRQLKLLKTSNLKNPFLKKLRKFNAKKLKKEKLGNYQSLKSNNKRSDKK